MRSGYSSTDASPLALSLPMLSSSVPSQSYAYILKRKEYAVVLSKNNVTVNRLLLTSGIVGPLCTHAGDDRRRRHPPGYNAWTMAGSSLSLSSYGWTQIANFIISGLLLLCFAAAAKASLPTGRGRFSCPCLDSSRGSPLRFSSVSIMDVSLPQCTRLLRNTTAWLTDAYGQAPGARNSDE